MQLGRKYPPATPNFGARRYVKPADTSKKGVFWGGILDLAQFSQLGSIQRGRGTHWALANFHAKIPIKMAIFDPQKKKFVTR